MGKRVEVVLSYSLGEQAGAGVGFAWAAGHWRIHGDSKRAVVVLPEQRCALIGYVCVCAHIHEHKECCASDMLKIRTPHTQGRTATR